MFVFFYLDWYVLYGIFWDLWYFTESCYKVYLLIGIYLHLMVFVCKSTYGSVLVYIGMCGM